MNPIDYKATGLDAWASRVKCPAQFIHIDLKYIYSTQRYIRITKSIPDKRQQKYLAVNYIS